jgi:hypothetical protein
LRGWKEGKMRMDDFIFFRRSYHGREGGGKEEKNPRSVGSSFRGVISMPVSRNTAQSSSTWFKKQITGVTERISVAVCLAQAWTGSKKTGSTSIRSFLPSLTVYPKERLL